MSIDSRYTTVTFYPKNLKARNKTAMYVSVHYEGERLLMPMGVSLAIKDLKQKNDKVEVKKQTQHYSAFNKRFDLIRDEAEKFVKHKIEVEDITPSPSTLKAHLLECITPKKESDSEQTFYDYFNQFIQERETGKDKAKGGVEVSKATIKKYHVLKTHLLGFDSYRDKKATFTSIGADYHNDFMDYLLNQKELSRNSAGNMTSVFKTFLKWAFKKGYSTNRAYENFERYTEETDSIYLSLSEIDNICNLDLTGNERLQRVRDLFIVGAFTALRISDFKRLQTSHLKDDAIHIKTKKTGEKVVIPLHYRIEDVLKRNNGEFPQAISDQKFNDYLKELGELAGLDEIITVTEKGKENQYRKFEKLSSHVCRRSAATNLYLSGEINTLDIMKITGHKTEKVFMKYIRVTAEENAKRVSKTSFFQRPADNLKVSHKAS